MFLGYNTYFRCIQAKFSVLFGFFSLLKRHSFENRRKCKRKYILIVSHETHVSCLHKLSMKEFFFMVGKNVYFWEKFSPCVWITEKDHSFVFFYACVFFFKPSICYIETGCVCSSLACPNFSLKVKENLKVYAVW